MKHAVRVDDFFHGAQMCDTSQSCHYSHACASEKCHHERDSDEAEKHVRATRRSVFTMTS